MRDISDPTEVLHHVQMLWITWHSIISNSMAFYILFTSDFVGRVHILNAMTSHSSHIFYYSICRTSFPFTLLSLCLLHPIITLQHYNKFLISFSHDSMIKTFNTFIIREFICECSTVNPFSRRYNLKGVFIVDVTFQPFVEPLFIIMIMVIEFYVENNEIKKMIVDR